MMSNTFSVEMKSIYLLNVPSEIIRGLNTNRLVLVSISTNSCVEMNVFTNLSTNSLYDKCPGNGVTQARLPILAITTP